MSDKSTLSVISFKMYKHYRNLFKIEIGKP